MYGGSIPPTARKERGNMDLTVRLILQPPYSIPTDCETCGGVFPEAEITFDGDEWWYGATWGCYGGSSASGGVGDILKKLDEDRELFDPKSFEKTIKLLIQLQ